jgi:hypothetical protein
VMKIFFAFATSFLEWVSFNKTTLQLGFFKFSEKKILTLSNLEISKVRMSLVGYRKN